MGVQVRIADPGTHSRRGPRADETNGRSGPDRGPRDPLAPAPARRRNEREFRSGWRTQGPTRAGARARTKRMGIQVRIANPETHTLRRPRAAGMNGRSGPDRGPRDPLAP